MKIVYIILYLLKFLSIVSMSCAGGSSMENSNGNQVPKTSKLPNMVENVDKLDKCYNSKNPDILLSRKKRALGFPDGTRLLITASLVKAILVGIPLGWNVALEIDVFYDLPKTSKFIRQKFKRLRLHNRQRRDLWGHFEEVLNLYGFKGQPCVLRAICEAQQYLAPKDTFLVHDILKTLFSAPDFGGPADAYSNAHKATDCVRFEKSCPFSLLKLLLSYERV